MRSHMVLYCEGLVGFQRVAIVVSSVLVFDNTFKTFQMLCTLFSPCLVCFDVQLYLVFNYFTMVHALQTCCFYIILYVHSNPRLESVFQKRDA